MSVQKYRLRIPNRRVECAGCEKFISSSMHKCTFAALRSPNGWFKRNDGRFMEVRRKNAERFLKFDDVVVYRIVDDPKEYADHKNKPTHSSSCCKTSFTGVMWLRVDKERLRPDQVVYDRVVPYTPNATPPGYWNLDF